MTKRAESIDPPSERTELLTAREVAKRWRVTQAHVYAMARDGGLPHVRLGRKYVRFREHAIEAWLDAQEGQH